MWGKVIGGLLGILMKSPVFFVFGILIGHFFDKAWHQFASFQTNFVNPFFQLRNAQQVFFEATFSVMGHVAKIDGRVNEQEINSVQNVMRQFHLNEDQRRQAVACFNAGKAPDFSLDVTLQRLRDAVRGQRLLLEMFLRLQYQTAIADGQLTAAEQSVIQLMARELGVAIDGGFGSQHSADQQYTHTASQRLAAAYRVLGVDVNVSDQELKKSYRKLMSQNHPDKLIAKGLPAEMLKLATERTQEIQQAYAVICEARGC